MYMDLTIEQLLLYVTCIIGAYLLGSINSAIIVSRSFSLQDPRTLGSGNPGATNVLRTGNTFAAGLTLLGDLLKGFIPVFLVDLFIGESYLMALVSLAALLGHVFPIYYTFKGGKGVATTLGILLGTEWVFACMWIFLWLLTALITRYSSLSALLATIIVCIAGWMWSSDFYFPSAFTIITLVIIWKHKSNIENLLGGKEAKIGQAK